MPICTQCWTSKPIEEYNRSGRHTDGRQRYRSACKMCSKQIAKKSRDRIRKAKLESLALCPTCSMNLGKRGAPLHERRAKQNSSELFVIAQDIQDLFNTGAISHPLFAALALRTSIVLRKIFGRNWKENEEKRSTLQRRWISENDFKVKSGGGYHCKLKPKP